MQTLPCDGKEKKRKKEASGRLGHKTLRTLMKRSSLWELPGVGTSSSTAGLGFNMCRLQDKRSTIEPAKNQIQTKIKELLAGSLVEGVTRLLLENQHKRRTQ